MTVRDPISTPALPGGLPFDATQIQFTQSGTGAVARSVQSKLREVLTSADNPTIGLHNTGVGESPLANITSGAGNTVAGFEAGKNITTSDENTANGFRALKSVTTTDGVNGRHNVANGSHALEENTTGTQNCATGNQALQLNTTGDNNVATGNAVLHDNISGSRNVGTGVDSLRFTTGSDNVATGTSALQQNVTGTTNTAAGGGALLNALGSGNVGVGFKAGQYETGSNAFYVDNQDRTNTAGDKANALIYGGFAAAAANQFLTVNGKLAGRGTATNDAAAQFFIGEEIESTVAVGSAVALTSGVAANVTSISLTAGDWDVSGIISYNGGATTNITTQSGGSSATSATFTEHAATVQSFSAAGIVPYGQGPQKFALPTFRYSISATTTIYLVAQATFTVSTNGAYGRIQARRIR